MLPQDCYEVVYMLLRSFDCAFMLPIDALIGKNSSWI